LHPELVVSATREVRAVLDARPAEAYLSANRTCEMGLRHATGRPYESFIFLLEKLSRPEGAHGNGATPMKYSDYNCFRFRFDSGVAFVSINHPPINLLDEALSQEFDQLGRQLETDESVRVVVLQSALLISS